ncbi:MAG: polysaccharide deacetylase [Alphaproteobacteria bacterium]|nr:polysaccharide deacetylase [Alphaproteobacteria bacterium]
MTNADWVTDERIAYATPATRTPMRWPGGKRLAVWIVPNLEYYEYLPEGYDFRDQFARIQHPDIMQWSWRDYGNRVGVWRMTEVLDAYPIAVTASTNLAIFEHCPEIAALVRDRSWEVMSHGIYNTRYLGRSTREEEEAEIRLSLDLCERHTGQRIFGLLGPCVTNSPWTMDLIANAGFCYHADWVHDDIPVPIRTTNGRLVSMPYAYDTNDGPALEGHFDAEFLVDSNIAQFDRLMSDARPDAGLVYCLPLHTYLIGQPHTIDALRRILDHVCASDDVWFAKGSEIAEAAFASMELAGTS